MVGGGVGTPLPQGTAPHARGRSSAARGAGAQVRLSQVRGWGADGPGVSPPQRRSVVEDRAHLSRVGGAMRVLTKTGFTSAGKCGRCHDKRKHRGKGPSEDQGSEGLDPWRGGQRVRTRRGTPPPAFVCPLSLSVYKRRERSRSLGTWGRRRREPPALPKVQAGRGVSSGGGRGAGGAGAG